MKKSILKQLDLETFLVSYRVRTDATDAPSTWITVTRTSMETTISLENSQDIVEFVKRIECKCMVLYKSMSTKLNLELSICHGNIKGRMRNILYNICFRIERKL